MIVPANQSSLESVPHCTMTLSPVFSGACTLRLLRGGAGAASCEDGWVSSHARWAVAISKSLRWSKMLFATIWTCWCLNCAKISL